MVRRALEWTEKEQWVTRRVPGRGDLACLRKSVLVLKGVATYTVAGSPPQRTDAHMWSETTWAHDGEVFAESTSGPIAPYFQPKKGRRQAGLLVMVRGAPVKWHRLLAFGFRNPAGLTWRQFRQERTYKGVKLGLYDVRHLNGKHADSRRRNLDIRTRKAHAESEGRA